MPASCCCPRRFSGGSRREIWRIASRASRCSSRCSLKALSARGLRARSRCSTWSRSSRLRPRSRFQRLRWRCCSWSRCCWRLRRPCGTTGCRCSARRSSRASFPPFCAGLRSSRWQGPSAGRSHSGRAGTLGWRKPCTGGPPCCSQPPRSCLSSRRPAPSRSTASPQQRGYRLPTTWPSTTRSAWCRAPSPRSRLPFPSSRA